MKERGREREGGKERERERGSGREREWEREGRVIYRAISLVTMDLVGPECHMHA